MLEKVKRGRPLKGKIPALALAEIRRFLSQHKSFRGAAKALGVTQTTICAWHQGRFRPALESALKMERIGAHINAELIMLDAENAFKDKDVRSHIFTHIIIPKADYLNISVEEYLTKWIPHALHVIIARNQILEHEIPFLVVNFGLTPEYWHNVQALYRD